MPPDTNSNFPRHIAIIMDGNGRWAHTRHLPRIQGHQAGVESIRDIVRACGEWGIAYLTLYAFSSENWNRPKDEVNFLMNLLSRYLDEELNELMSHNVRFHAVGRLEELPDVAQKKIVRNIELSQSNTGLNLIFALSYSSQCEIVDAVKRIARAAQEGRIDIEGLTPEVFANYLYTAGIPNPDLLIRTSGEMRISNFLLWQLSYTELYITEKLWPDFRRQDLRLAIEEYAKRERRFGRASHTH